MPEVITVDRRFNGPPDSGHGGYVCGLIAGAVRQAVNVRLHKPTPLETPLTIVPEAPGHWRVSNNGELIATAAPAEVDIPTPRAQSYVEALVAARHYRGFKHHVFPTCFVCGPARRQGDGLRVFAGAAPGARTVAAPWLPDVALADGDGKVRPEYIWAVLDCPGYFALLSHGAAANPSGPDELPAMLGELAVRIDRRVPADEPCVVVGWAISAEGRKHRVGTALYAEDGDVCAVGLATWIELKR